MSSRGYRQIQLAQEAQRRIREQRDRKQAKSLLKSCQKQIKGISDPIVQQLVRDKLSYIQQEIERTSKDLSSRPAAALNMAKSIQANLQGLLSNANVKAQEIRFENMKKQAGDLVNTSKEMIQSISEPAIQQIIGDQLKPIQERIKEASGLIESDPANAGKRIKNIQSELQKILAKGQEKAAKLVREQAIAKSAVELARQNIESQKENSNHTTESMLKEGMEKAQQAASFYKQGKFKHAITVSKMVQDISKQIEEQSFDETVRRKVVGGLVSTLKQKGFVVQGPVLEGQDPRTGSVVLHGQMPSGKKAAFAVNLDGKMEFDFDGYQGRACGQEMEKIEQELNKHYEVKLGPAQVNWKNPDRLTKGAMNAPTGNSFRK